MSISYPIIFVFLVSIQFSSGVWKDPIKWILEHNSAENFQEAVGIVKQTTQVLIRLFEKASEGSEDEKLLSAFYSLGFLKIIKDDLTDSVCPLTEESETCLAYIHQELIQSAFTHLERAESQITEVLTLYENEISVVSLNSAIFSLNEALSALIDVTETNADLQDVREFNDFQDGVDEEIDEDKSFRAILQNAELIIYLSLIALGFIYFIYSCSYRRRFCNGNPRYVDHHY